MSDSPQRSDAPEVAAEAPRRGLGAILALPNDSPKKMLLVAISLCLVCSVVVSSAAVLLRPMQAQNAALDRKRNIVEVAGLLGANGDVVSAFQRIEERIVDLRTGQFTQEVEPGRFDDRKAARDPALSARLPQEQDIASIRRRTHYATVYLVRKGDAIEQVILPVHGYGLWSTLYGFLALKGDLRTVAGLKFYEHAETPGLGGEVDNPAWRAKWEGKVAIDQAGKVVIEVARGVVDESRPGAEHRVDGLAGATLTSRGVDNLLNFWLGENGFGPFLARLRNQEIR